MAAIAAAAAEVAMIVRLVIFNKLVQLFVVQLCLEHHGASARAYVSTVAW